MWSEFGELLCKLEEEKRLVNIWFRDDDMGACIPEAKGVLDLFDELEIPVLLSVIPGAMKEQTAEWIRGSKTAWVGQHGLFHQDNSITEGLVTEFDDALWDVDTMVEKIMEYKTKLQQDFGKQFNNSFIAPWNVLNPTLEEAISRCGFDFISNGGVDKFNSYHIYELNTRVDMVNWDVKHAYAGEEYFFGQLFSALKEDMDAPEREIEIGVLSHQWAIKEDGFEFLWKFTEFLRKFSGVNMDFRKCLEGKLTR